MLSLVFVGLNFIYEYTLYPKDLYDKCSEIFELKVSQDTTDIYYFAESSNFNVRENDSIQNTISEIVNFFYPSLRITAINKPATHAGIYKHWIKQINPKVNKPKAIVVTLNMRSFDAMWVNSVLETQLQESLVLTQPRPALVNRFFLSLQVFDNKNDQQREKTMLTDWDTTKLIFPFDFRYKTVREWDYSTNFEHFYKNPDGTKDEAKTILACHYIKAYALNMNERNPRVRDFDEIADWCNKNKVNLYLNLMAENLEYADSLVGKELVFLMKQNRDYLVKRYQKNNCIVVDNLELVSGIEFTDQTWTTEHYSYKGRMSIAKNVAKSLSKQFSNEYKNAY
ncbi:MAG: hypothetical protein ABIP51_19165 [Bacteroidia bacterium]